MRARLRGARPSGARGTREQLRERGDGCRVRGRLHEASGTSGGARDARADGRGREVQASREHGRGEHAGTAEPASARRVEAGERLGPALQALLALEAGADDLLAGDPSLSALRRLLYRLRALSCSASADLRGAGAIGVLRERCRRCAAQRGLARAAGAVAAEIQAWADRETVAQL